MLNRRKGGDYSLSNPPSLINADLEKISLTKKEESDADYESVCTNNKYALQDEERDRSTNEHKSYDCNLCARICYLAIKVTELS